MSKVGVINEKKKGTAFRDGKKELTSFQDLEDRSRIHIDLGLEHVKRELASYSSSRPQSKE